MKEKAKSIIYHLKYRKKWWHPFSSWKIVRINLCDHNWVEIARGQFKKKYRTYRTDTHWDYSPEWASKCLGDTMTLKCKKCGEIKTIGVDIVK